MHNTKEMLLKWVELAFIAEHNVDDELDDSDRFSSAILGSVYLLKKVDIIKKEEVFVNNGVC